MNKQFHIFGDDIAVKYRKIIVHKIGISGGSLDPDIELATPLHKWQQTPAGQFIMKNAVEIDSTRCVEFDSFSFMYYIFATLEEKKITEYYLKFDIREVK